MEIVTELQNEISNLRAENCELKFKLYLLAPDKLCLSKYPAKSDIAEEIRHLQLQLIEARKLIQELKWISRQPRMAPITRMQKQLGENFEILQVQIPPYRTQSGNPRKLSQESLLPEDYKERVSTLPPIKTTL